MKFLISFYDNALIYYPNVFFAVLFFVSILGIVAVIMGIIVFGREVGKFIKAIESGLKQKKIKKRKKISFVPMVRFFLERKKNSFVCIIRFLIIYFAYMVKVTFIRINAALGYVESHVERIAKKIGKEVLIDE